MVNYNKRKVKGAWEHYLYIDERNLKMRAGITLLELERYSDEVIRVMTKDGPHY